MKNMSYVLSYAGLCAVAGILVMFCLFELLITIGAGISTDYPYFYPFVILLLIISIGVAIFSFRRISA